MNRVATVRSSLEHVVRVIRLNDDDGRLPLMSLRDFVSESRRTRVTLRRSCAAVVDGEEVVL